MQFKQKSIAQYNKQWASLSPMPIHQSNPQPFTLAELENLIGKAEDFDPEKELAHATTQGDVNLRESITLLYDHNDANRIATFAGAQEAIFCCINSLLKSGDTVAAITPIFEPLIDNAQELGCEIKFIPLLPKEHWEIDLNKLEKTINSGCKLLIINFPNNPTGAMVRKEELLQIIEICDKNNCWILSDEVFRGLEYDEIDRLPSVADLYPKAISIGVLSKAFSLAALRIGWINCQDKNLIDQILNVKLSLSICNSFLDEKLATHIIQNHQKIWGRNKNLIKNNFEKLNNFMLNKSDIFNFIQPKAGSVCFPLLRNISSSNFAEQLIKKHNLLVLPGKLFSTDQNGFRFGFGYDENLCEIEKLGEIDQ